MKKIAGVMIVAGALLFIHQRTPFFLRKGGPWSIGFGQSAVIAKIPAIDKNKLYTPEKLGALAPGTQFLADPFFIHERDTFYLFFEHKYKDNPRATIGLLTSVDGVNYNFRGEVLKADFHLSYPQVYKHKNEFYMVPESKQAGHILLYKAKNFPFDWEVVDTLVENVRLKDPTLFISDTLNMLVASDDHLSMYLYRADSLNGKWVRQNRPILQGSEARPGGRIFPVGSKLHFPVQNCSHGYGSGLSIYEFEFGKENIKLRKIHDRFLKGHKKIPEFGFGMHTFDIQKVGNGYYYVLDGNRFANDEKYQAIRYALKLSLYDLKNLLN